VSPERDHDAIAEGFRLHNQGRHLEAHHALEDAWRGASGARRKLLQGLVQLTAAGVHLERARARPAVMLPDRAAANLEAAQASGEPLAPPVDVARLVTEIRTARRRIAEAARTAPGPDAALLPPMSSPAGAGDLSCGGRPPG